MVCSCSDLHAPHSKSLNRSILTAAVTGPTARVVLACAEGEPAAVRTRVARVAAKRRVGMRVIVTFQHPAGELYLASALTEHVEAETLMQAALVEARKAL